MLEDLTPPDANRGSCKVHSIASTLDESDRAILYEAVADKNRWPVKTLSRALSEKGLLLSESPINNHRNKSCACFR